MKKIIITILLLSTASTFAMEKTNIIDMQEDQSLPTISKTNLFTKFNDFPHEIRSRIIWSNLHELLSNKKPIELQHELKSYTLVSSDFLPYYLIKDLFKLVHKINQYDPLPIASTNLAKSLTHDHLIKLYQDNQILLPGLSLYRGRKAKWKALNVKDPINLDDIKKQILQGADVNSCYPVYGTIALIDAAVQGNDAIVRLLIQSGADINLPKNSQTALMWATAFRRTNVVNTLINAGAKINIQDNSGETALIKAAEKNINTQDIVHALINAGAEINIQDNKGETALIKAVMKKNTSIVNALIEAGANVDLKNTKGDTALTIAQSHGYMVNTLRQASSLPQDSSCILI